MRAIVVVENTREAISEDFQHNMYVPLLREPPRFFRIMIRTGASPGTYRRGLLDASSSVDADQPLWEIMPLEEHAADARADLRFLSTMVVGFAGLALVLLALGLYGVVAYSVGTRRREIGVRVALGAGGRTSVRMLLRQSIVLSVVGAGLGTVGALAVALFPSAAVFGAESFDTASFVVAPSVLVFVTVAASHPPGPRYGRSATGSTARGGPLEP